MLKRWLTISKPTKRKSELTEAPSSDEKNDKNDVLSGPSIEELKSIISLDPIDSPKIEQQKESDDAVVVNEPSMKGSKVSPIIPSPALEYDHQPKNNTVMNESINNKSFDDIDLDNISPIITDLMPYGDGSNKIFGYENFGNTCYCNSILQCLYNIPEFRENILKYPLRNDQVVKWEQKKAMVGKTLRTFNQAMFENSRSNSNYNSNMTNGNNERETSMDPKSSSSGRNILSGFLKSSMKSSESQDPLKQVLSQEGSSPKDGKINSNESRSNSNINENRIHNVHRFKRIIVGRPNTSSFSRESSDDLIVGEESGQVKKHDGNGSNNNDNSNIHNTNNNDYDNNIRYNRDIKHAGIDLSNEQRKQLALINGPIVNLDHPLNTTERPNLYNGLKDIFESINENSLLTGVVSPSSFIHVLKKENILFNTMMHQDAHEFLNFLLNDLSEYADSHSNKFGNKDPNFIKELFQGTQTSKIKCLTCDSVTTRHEPFLDFPIEVKEGGATDVQDVLHNFSQRELLGGTNKFYCNLCCGLQEAERVVGIKQLPRILALHLKRFKYSETENSNIKLFNRISYPLVLDVQSTFDVSVLKRYELTGIVMHMGGGPQHGHYVSLCKTAKFGWLFFDDETVETVDESTVLRFTGDANSLTTAYVLFYKEIGDTAEQLEPLNMDSFTKKQYRENVDNLLKYDSALRNKQKAQEELIKNKRKTEKDDSNTMPEDNVDARGTDEETHFSSSNKVGRRKSRLFSFMKN